MKVILLKDIKNVGRKYEIKDVSEGYAMNSLIPQGVAQAATGGALKRLESLKGKEAKMREQRESLLAGEIGKISEAAIVMKGKANDKGHLFASIHKNDIAEEFGKQTGMEIDPDHIALDKPVKEVGEHDIAVSIGGKTASFKLTVESE